jgi:hypothetical protein
LARGSYTKYVSKTMGKIEAMLKVLLKTHDPPDGLVEHYILLYADNNIGNFQKIIELKVPCLPLHTHTHTHAHANRLCALATQGRHVWVRRPCVCVCAHTCPSMAVPKPRRCHPLAPARLVGPLLLPPPWAYEHSWAGGRVVLTRTMLSMVVGVL